MVLGYIIVGSFAGFITSVASLILGGSYGLALALYSIVGSTVAILVPLTQVAISALIARFARGENTPASERTSGSLVAAVGPKHSKITVDEHPRPMRILAVDDDPFILGLIPGIAANARYSEVTCAASAKLALAAMASAEDPFDCLLFDINMPEMDGIELCRRVRNIAAYRHTPIIMLTGKRDMRSMEEAFRAGATDYATKPFDVVELGERLASTYQAPDRQGNEVKSDKASSTDIAREAGHNSLRPSDTVIADGLAKLVSPKALENYMTEVPGKELSSIQVFAVKVDWSDPADTRTSYLPFESVLRNVAAAIGEVVNFEQCMMADVGEGTILVVASGNLLRTSIELEGEINRSLQACQAPTVQGENLSVSVSVGRTIVPEGTKAHRAGNTFGRAIGSAKNRAREKLGANQTRSPRLVG